MCVCVCERERERGVRDDNCFLLLRYWGLHNNLELFWYFMVRVISTKVEGSIDVATLFIGISLSSFLNGEFFLPIGDLASIILPLA
mgnify:CR=1 FL=1